MKRAVITGMGIVSSIGNNKAEVLASLKEGRSGITFSEEFAEVKLRSQVWGQMDIDTKALVDRKQLRFMGDASAYAYIAMKEAIADADLPDDMVSNIRTGIIAGSGGASSKNQIEAAETLRTRGAKRVGAY
ncbi:MAG: 3-oxoacyl-[acyl-carrier-protein] synthase-1, partial [Phenylobacterium sp.]